MLRQAQHERGGALHHLICHPDTPANAIEGISGQILSADAQSMMIEFGVRRPATLLLPAQKPPARADGLWRTTCFEAFIQPSGSETYLELNFSPSFAWAAYGFSRYREGMVSIDPRLDPEIMMSDPVFGPEHFFLSAEFDIGRYIPGPSRIGLSAVIEETDGTKSYWALAHPPGKPDFHHPACFALELPALG